MPNLSLWAQLSGHVQLCGADRWFCADYAANGGSNCVMWWWGPSTGRRDWRTSTASVLQFHPPFQDMTQTNRISAQRSQRDSPHNQRGVQHLLGGDKYLDADLDTTGSDGGDDQWSMTGDSDDCQRWTAYLPRMDGPVPSTAISSAAAHAASFNMAFCDVPGEYRQLFHSTPPPTFTSETVRNGDADRTAINCKEESNWATPERAYRRLSHLDSPTVGFSDRGA